MLADGTAGLTGDLSGWANLAAVTVITLLFVWYQIKRLPELQQRAEAREDMKAQQFFEALKGEREQRIASASEGHAAARALGDGVAMLTRELQRFNDGNSLAAHRMNNTQRTG